jgi:hypothetical protein
MNFDSAGIPSLDLEASYIGEIFAPGLVVNGDADIGFDGYDYGNDLHASGEVFLENARVGGHLSLGGGKFHYSPAQASSNLAIDLSRSGREALKPAVDLTSVQVKGELNPSCGFEAQGGVLMSGATLGTLPCAAGHFINAGATC